METLLATIYLEKTFETKEAAIDALESCLLPLRDWLIYYATTLSEVAALSPENRRLLVMAQLRTIGQHFLREREASSLENKTPPLRPPSEPKGGEY